MPVGGFEKQGMELIFFFLVWKYKWGKLFLVFGFQKDLKEKKNCSSVSWHSDEMKLCW